jgi:geranylgeranyl reductase family protein
VYDVAVVGAGPAGCTAAWAAASAGCRVLLLEKAVLPRYKTCGGGIVGASAQALPPGVTLPLRDEVDAVEFTMNGRLRRVRRTGRPPMGGVAGRGKALFGLVDRAEFDAALAEAAVAAGATLRDGSAVQRVDEDAEGVRLSLAGGEVVRANVAVGADGSASRLGAYVGVRLSEVDLGLEAEIPVPAEVAAVWRGRVLLDWGPLPGSYAWVFPKGDALTVGVISARGEGEATRRYLRDFIARLDLQRFPPSVSSGHLTRCRQEASPLSRGRVLVAGDAAGLLEPWTREGISYALRSGRLAGQAAARMAQSAGWGRFRQASSATGTPDAAGDYEAAVEATLGREMRVGRQLRQAFQHRPLAFHAAVTLVPAAWRIFSDVVRGNSSFPDVLQRRAPRRALQLVARGQH